MFDSQPRASTQKDIPHVENVDLVPKSHSGAGAHGFNARHSFGLSLGFFLMILLHTLSLAERAGNSWFPASFDIERRGRWLEAMGATCRTLPRN
jgi:hypothetical protein